MKTTPLYTVRLGFLKDQIGIDASPLTDEDVKKTCEFVVRAMSLEMPRFAERYAKELKLNP